MTKAWAKESVAIACALAVVMMMSLLAPSAAVAASVPGPLRDFDAQPLDSGAVLAFRGPDDTGGVALTNYEYTLDGGLSWIAFDPPVTSVDGEEVSLDGLVNGQAYQVAMRAVNPMGAGPATVQHQIIAGAPGRPEGSVNPIAGDGRIDVYHREPLSDNGSPVTNYEYSLDGGVTWIAPDPPETDGLIIVEGVVNGQTYSPWVRAVNARGPSPFNDRVRPVTVGTPLAPKIETVVPGRGAVTAYFTRASDNGSPVTNYEYFLQEAIDPCDEEAPGAGGPDVTPAEQGPASDWAPFDPPITQGPVTFVGLTDGVCYVLGLRAVNARGSGLEGVANGPVFPGAPTAPTDVRATPGDMRADIAFTVPQDNGSPITKYRYLAHSGLDVESDLLDPPAAGDPLTIPGLDNGRRWEVQILAINANGWGPWSRPVDVTPRTVPAAPENLVATPMYASAEVTFTPGDDGGSQVKDHQFRSKAPGAQWGPWVSAGSAVSPIKVPGLPNGVPVEVELRAVNDAGAGAAASVVVTPMGAVFSGLETSLRVFDSRVSQGGSGPVTPQTPVMVDVQAPSGAVAVAYNLTLLDTVGAGHVAVGPSGADLTGTSTANWFGTGQRWANAYVSKVGADGMMQVVARGGATEVIVDVTGFYLANGQAPPAVGAMAGQVGLAATADSVFVPVTPVRAYDSRGIDGPIASGQERVVGLGSWVPEGATAVAYTLTVTETTGSGHLSVGVPGAGKPATSVINWFTSGQNVANSATAVVSQGREVSVFAGGGPTEFIVDVLGYFMPVDPSAGQVGLNTRQGLRFTAIDPARAYDSRLGQGRITNGSQRTTTVLPAGGLVPPGVGAVAFNLTETDTAERGHLRVTAGGAPIPAVSTINWYATGMRVANGSVVEVNNDQMTTYAVATMRGSTNYIVDIAGYYN